MILLGLSKKFVDNNILDKDKAINLLESAKKTNTSFISSLVANKIMSFSQVAAEVAENFGLPLFNLDKFNLELIKKDTLDIKFIKNLKLLPLLKRANNIFVAVADPTDIHALDEIKFKMGLEVHPIIVEEDKLLYTIQELSTVSKGCFDNLDAELKAIPIDSIEEETNNSVISANSSDTPIMRLIDKVLLEAINQKASDIHFEPYEKLYRVRFRKDGILYEAFKPPVNFASTITTRLKVMSNLDIAEHRIPQDGRFKITIANNKDIDIRISSCPTLFGEKIVLRILDSSNSKINIEDLGYELKQKDLFVEAIHKPQGMVLITGPTGSGKTVSLYTALNMLNTLERNISTCEDPVEINLEGINQVNVNPKAKLTFVSALKSFLRQDPDIIMVGEIRDLETAEIAIKASQTGHLVLSTLHTNTAAETLNRFINMGVPIYNLATSISLVIAQRLVRCLCNNCKKKTNFPMEFLLENNFTKDECNNIAIYAAVGCNQCSNGYKGRTGIYEVMPINEDISRIIMAGANVLDIEKQAIADGMWTLRYSGIQKVKQGITSFEEINRVIKG